MKLVLGYWGVGVTTLVAKINDAGGKAIELRDFPIDIEQVQKLQNDGFVVFSYIDRDNVKILEREQMDFALVYPALFCKDDYATRAAKDGDNLKTVHLLKQRWTREIIWISSVRGHPTICLGKNEFIPELSDPRYTEIPFPKE